MPVGPFGAELVVFSLHQNLSIMAVLPGLMGRIHCGSDGFSLRPIGAVVLPVEIDLPLSLVEHDVVNGARHGALPFRNLDT